jgi:hypothetical protein
MLRMIIKLLVFYALFIGMAMGGIYVFDNRPNEMLGFALWGGVLYALISIAPWIYLSGRFVNKIDDVNPNTKEWFIGLIIFSVFLLIASAGTGEPLIFIYAVVNYNLSFLLATLLISIIWKIGKRTEQ